MAPKKIMKFLALAVVTTAISKIVQGMKQGIKQHVATETASTPASADQWPSVPRREEDS